jgi:hypothetical protein
MLSYISSVLGYLVTTILIVIPIARLHATASANGALAAGQSTTSVTGVTSFTMNVGQWDDSVLCRSHGGSRTLWLVRDGFYTQYLFSAHSDSIDREPDVTVRDVSGVGRTSEPPTNAAGLEPDKNARVALVKTVFVGATGYADLVAKTELPAVSNFFMGNDTARWKMRVPSYAEMTFEEVYPGIDVRFYGAGKELEYDVVVSPGADPGLFRLRYLGADSVRLSSEGCLIVYTESGRLIEAGPLMYQPDGRVRHLIAGRFAVADDGAVSFHIDGEFDRSAALIIDPVLSFSSYFGGAGEEVAFDVAVDSKGDAVVVGYTTSGHFPDSDPCQGTYMGDRDVFITKVSGRDYQTVFTTYLGGRCWDFGYAVAVDSDDGICITGETSSNNFPLWYFYQWRRYSDLSDAFLSKLSSTGDTLRYSTYFGRASIDRGYDIAMSPGGSAVITGITVSPDLPVTADAVDATFNGGSDVFIARFSDSGNVLRYCTYLGGENDDASRDAGRSHIAVDRVGNLYVAGCTFSPDFPLRNPLRAEVEQTEVFVTKLADSGKSIAYSTLVGGAGYDAATGIAVDRHGAAYVVGSTVSADFPVARPYCRSYQGDHDGFVFKLDPTGTALDFSTYINGTVWYADGFDVPRSIVVEDDGSCLIAGYTDSYVLPGNQPLIPHAGWFDIFVLQFSPDGQDVPFTTWLGGTEDDYGWSLALDGQGGAFVVGDTKSPDFPLVSEYSSAYAGNYDVFIAHFDDIPTDVAEPPPTTLPQTCVLNQNYPNPFNPSTEISFDLNRRCEVKLVVINAIGQIVTTLVSQRLPAGSYSLRWDGIDSRGGAVASGVYFCQLTAGSSCISRKMVLAR